MTSLEQTGGVPRPPAPSLDLNALLHRGPLYVKTMLLPGRRAWVNRHVMLLSHSLEWYADSSMSTVVGSVSLLGATAILAPPKPKSSVPSSAASVSSTGSGGHASPQRGGVDRSELVFELEWPDKGEFLPLRATSPEQFTIWIQALLQSSASVSFDLVQKSGAVVKSGLTAGSISTPNVQEQGFSSNAARGGSEPDAPRNVTTSLDNVTNKASVRAQSQTQALPHSFSETHHTEGSHTALYHATELLSGPMYILVANEGASLRLASESWMPRFAMLESATVDGADRPDESGNGSILRLYEQLSESDLRESEMILISNSRSEIVPPRANNPPDTNCFVITVRSGRQVFLATPLPVKKSAAGADRERPPTREQWISILNSNSQANRNRPIAAASNDVGAQSQLSTLSTTSQSNSVTSDTNPAEKNLPPHLRRKKGLASAAAAVMLLSKTAAPVPTQEPLLPPITPVITPTPLAIPLVELAPISQDIPLPNDATSDQPLIDFPPSIDTEGYQANNEFDGAQLTSRNDDDTLESYTDRNREDEEDGGLITTEGGDLRDLLDENFDSVSTAGGYVPGSGSSTYPNSHRGSISASGLPPGTSTNDVVMYLTQRVTGNFARRAMAPATNDFSARNIENSQSATLLHDDGGIIAETPQSPESVATYASGFAVGSGVGGGGSVASFQAETSTLPQPSQHTLETRAHTSSNQRDSALRAVIASASAALNAANFERGRDAGVKPNQSNRYSVPPVEEVEDEEQLAATENDESDGTKYTILQPVASSTTGGVTEVSHMKERRAVQPNSFADVRSSHDKLIANAARATSTLLSMQRALSVSTPLISQLPIVSPSVATASIDAAQSSSSLTSTSSPSSHIQQQPAFMKRLNRSIILPSTLSSPSVSSAVLGDTSASSSSSPALSMSSYVPPSLLAASSPSLIFEKFKARRIGITPQSNLLTAATAAPQSLQQTLTDPPTSESTEKEISKELPLIVEQQHVTQSEPEPKQQSVQEDVSAPDLSSSNALTSSPAKQPSSSASPSTSSSSPRRPMESSSAVALGIVASGNLPLPPSPWAGRRAVERFVATELTALSTALASALSPEALGTLASVPLPDAQAPDDAREETAARSMRDELDETYQNEENVMGIEDGRLWENIWSSASAPITAADSQQKSAISGAISRAAAAGFAIQADSSSSSSTTNVAPLSSILPLSPRAKSDLSLILSSVVCASSGYTLNKEAAAELQPVLPDAGNSGPIHLQLDAATAQRISSRVARTLHADAIWRTAPSTVVEKEPTTMVEEEQQTEEIMPSVHEIIVDESEAQPMFSPTVPHRAAPPVPLSSPTLILSAGALATAHKNALFSFYLEHAPSKATVENVDGIWNSYSVALWPKLAEKYGTENVAKYAPPPYNSLLPATSVSALRNDDKSSPRKISTSPSSATTDHQPSFVNAVSSSPSIDNANVEIVSLAQKNMSEEILVTSDAGDVEGRIAATNEANTKTEDEKLPTTSSIDKETAASDVSVVAATVIEADTDLALTQSASSLLSSSTSSDVASIAAAAVAALGDPDLSFLASPSRRTFRNRRRLSSSSSSSAPAAPTSVLQSPSFLLAMKILNSADDEEAPTGALPMLSKDSSGHGVISTLPAISTLSTSVSASTLTPPVAANTVRDESIQSAETAVVSSSTERHDDAHVAVAPENVTSTNEIITSIVEGLVSAAAASWSPTISTESVTSSDKVSDEGIVPGTTRSDAVDAHRLEVETTSLESSVAETLSSNVPVAISIEIAAASIGDISTSETTSSLDAKSTSTDALSSDSPQFLPDIISSLGSSSSQSTTIVVTPPRPAIAQSSVDHQAEPPVPSPLPPPPVSSGWAFADPSRVAAKFIPPQSANSSSSPSLSLNGASPITQRLIGASVVVISVDSGPSSPIAGLIRLVTLVDTKKGGDDETSNDDKSHFEYVIGVELDTPSGSSDGSNNGILYFECEGNTSVGARPGSSASLPYAVFIPITVQVSGGRVLLFTQPSQPLPPTAGAFSLVSSSASASATNASTHSDVQSIPIANTTQPIFVPREAQVVRFDETSFASSTSSSSMSTSTSHPTRAANDSETAADAAEPRSVMAYDGIEEDEDENDEAGDQSTNSNQQQQQRSMFLLRNGARSYAAANLARLSSNAPVPPPAPAAPSPSVTAVQAKRPPWNKSVITPWRRVDVKEKLLLSSLDNPVAEGLSMNVMFSSSDKRGPLTPSSSTASQLMSRPSGKMPLLATQPNLAMSQATQQMQMHPPIPDIDADVDARVVAWLDAIMLPHAAIPIAESIALAKFYASAMMEGTSSQMMDAAADGKVLVVPVNLSDVAALQGPEIAALPGLSVADAVKLGEAVVALRVIVPTGGSAQKIAPDSTKANVSSSTAALDSEKPMLSYAPPVDTLTPQLLPVSLPASSSSKAPHQIEDAKRLQSLPPLSPLSFNLPASSSASYKQPQKSMSPDAFVSSSSSSPAAATSPTTLSPAAADAESRLLPWELEKLSKEREKEKSALAAAASSSVRSLQLQSQMSQQAHGQQPSISSAQREQDSLEDKEGLIAPVTPSSSNSVTVGQIANFATEAALKRAQKALAASRNTSSSTPRMTAGSASSSSAPTSGVRPSSTVQPPPLPSLSGNSKMNTPSSSTSMSSSTRAIGETAFAAAAAAARQSTSKVSSALKPASPRSSNAAKKASMSPSRHSISASASSPRKERTTAPDIELPGGVVVSASSVIEAGVALTPAQLNALLGDDSKEMQGTEREGEGVSSARESNVSRSSPRTAKEIRASSRHVVPSHIVPPRARSKSSAASTSTSEVSSSENVRPVSSISATSTRNGTTKSDSSSSLAATQTTRKSNTDGGSSVTGSSPKKQQQQTPTASRRQSSVDDKRVSFSDADTVASTSSPSRKSSTAALSTTGKGEDSGMGNSFKPDLKAATAHVGDPSRGQDRDRLRKLLSGRSLIPRPAGIGASGTSSIVSSSSLITEQASPTSLNLPAPRSPPRSVQPRSPEPQLADIQFTDVEAALVAKLKDIHMVPYAPQFGLFGFGTIEKAKALSVEDLTKKLSIPIVDARKIKASL